MAERSKGYGESANSIVSTQCRKLPNSHVYRFINVGSCTYFIVIWLFGKYTPSKHVGIGVDAQVRVILTVSKQFYLHNIVLKEVVAC